MKIKNNLIVLVIILAIALILFIKWPRPLSSYLDRPELSTAAGLIRSHSNQNREKIEIYEVTRLKPLLEAIDAEARLVGSFECDGTGTIYINGKQYAIFGSNIICTVLDGYYAEGLSSKLLSK